jgi:hypothetical protein
MDLTNNNTFLMKIIRLYFLYFGFGIAGIIILFVFEVMQLKSILMYIALLLFSLIIFVSLKYLFIKYLDFAEEHAPIFIKNMYFGLALENFKQELTYSLGVRTKESVPSPVLADRWLLRFC